MAPEASPSSTTESQQAATPESGSTLLTGNDDDQQAATPEGDDQSEPDPRAAFYGAPEGDAGYEISGLPEGVEIDREALEAVAPVAKELNLSNEGLSKIAGVYAEKVLPAVVANVESEMHRQIAATHSEWANQATQLVQEDPAFEGKKLPEVKSVAAKALDRFGGAEFRKFLDESGLGNHPSMMKFAYLAGSSIAEDTFERGGATTTPKSSVEKFYGTT